MKDTAQFRKLFNLTVEINESHIEDIQVIKDILLRESMDFIDRKSNLHIYTPIGLVHLFGDGEDSKRLWDAIEMCLDEDLEEKVY